MTRREINTPFVADKKLLQFLDNLPDSFESGGTALWNGRNRIKLFEISATMPDAAPRLMVVKCFKHPNFVQQIGYAFSTHKACRAYRNGLELIRRGFVTPCPIAFVEKRGCCRCVEDAYYICEPTDLPCIEGETDRDDWNRALAKDFAAYVAALHKRGVLHHDLNDTNVLYRKSPDGGYTFEVIDINRMKFFAEGAEIPFKERVENLTRFTGRIDLFEYVAREYFKTLGVRDLENEVALAVSQKLLHDRRWRRRKALCHPFRKQRNKNKTT